MPEQIRLIVKEIFPADNGSIPTILFEVEDTDLKLKGYFSTGDITFEVNGTVCRFQGALADYGIVSLGRANYLVRLLRGKRVKFLSRQEVDELFYSVPESAKISILKEELKINGRVEYLFGHGVTRIVFNADLGDFKNEELFVIGFKDNTPILATASQFAHITDTTKVAKDEFADKLIEALKPFCDCKSVNKVTCSDKGQLAYEAKADNCTILNIIAFTKAIDKCFTDAGLSLLDLQIAKDGYIFIYDTLPQ